ncbi:hypothetical protein Mlute_00532 [Meiothermus luteus]|jgi:uncharacterized repeat protein (TIGR01451 family)|uniref:DUF11 domain-containing protein n=1 Tax=Meiothermus luteus TaxID=2026184 RepID=A0A399EW11_9DEIN|nr:DUF11 domain-containing protein [Meiothermus luteus]RIH88744.1 hypothetical protein Mlute_00532 [Meiothermus luteus]RMH58853.1 MAG: DUF11 domain-containing protein [Deinococcota bacterium]
MHPFHWFAAALLLLGSALAQGREEVRLELKAFLVTSLQQEGRTVERLLPALEARPGQVIEYRLEATNTTDRPLSQVALVVPIPTTTRYLENSAQALQREGWVLPEFSFDGGQTYGRPPLKRVVRVVENGKEVRKEVEVKPEEYTHARWVIPQLGPKESVSLRLRAVVR